MGRTNKLVDGCYSFWQGAVFPVLNGARPGLAAEAPGIQDPAGPWLQQAEASQQEAEVSMCCSSGRLSHAAGAVEPAC